MRLFTCSNKTKSVGNIKSISRLCHPSTYNSSFIFDTNSSHLRGSSKSLLMPLTWHTIFPLISFTDALGSSTVTLIWSSHLLSLYCWASSSRAKAWDAPTGTMGDPGSINDFAFPFYCLIVLEFNTNQTILKDFVENLTFTFQLTNNSPRRERKL